MRKSNRVAGNGDSNRPRAQSQKTPQQTPRNPADELSQINLAELLEGDTRLMLFKLAGDGLPLKAQIAGAVNSWAAFAGHFGTSATGRQIIMEAPGVLCPGQFECSIARERSRFISAPTANFFRSLLARARQMPRGESLEYLERLAELIEFHPGLADELKSLHELLDAESSLGNSEAVRTVLAGSV